MSKRDVLEFLLVGPLFSVTKQLNGIRKELGQVATQDDINQLTSRVNAASDRQAKGIGEVRSEIQKLQEANPSLDLSGLEAAVSKVESGAQSLDDIVADTPSEVPVIPADESATPTTEVTEVPTESPFEDSGEVNVEENP